MVCHITLSRGDSIRAIALIESCLLKQVQRNKNASLDHYKKQ